MALRLINPSGAGGVFLHWGDTGSQPPVPPERWTLDGRLTFDFRLVQRPTAFGTFRMMELDSNHPVSGPNNSNLQAITAYADDWTGNGTITRVHAFGGANFQLQTNFWYTMDLRFYAVSNALTAGDGQSRGSWYLIAISNGVTLATSPVQGYGDGSQNLPFGERINQMLIGNWFSNGVGFDIDSIMLVAPEPSAVILLGLGGLLLLGRRAKS